MAESSTITREMIEAPQEQGEKALWYMHVSGPDDVHAVPDFWTGLAWAAELNAFVAARAAKEKWAADDNWPLTQATIRRWTWSADQHAKLLARELSERQEHAEKRAAATTDLERENRELRAYLKAFCAATIDPEDRGRDVSAHQANPFITYQFQHVEEDEPQAERTITGGQVRRAMELVGFDKLKIQPADRTISEELTEARDLRREVKTLRSLLDDALALLEVGPEANTPGTDTYTFLVVAKEALRQTAAGPEEPHRCFACAEPFKDGDRVFEDVNEGTIHADCCGPERESYVGADGEPLKPSEPIPEPGIYQGAPRAAGSTQAAFRAGDIVRHKPSGETWTVAYADQVSNNLAWCGWPDGAARLSDCTLIRAATDEQHRDVLREVIQAGGTRAAAAQRLYGNPDQDAQEAARG